MSARLDEMERLARYATAGAWRWYNGCSKHAAVIRPTVDRDGQPNLIVSQADMDLIAALRNASPALLAIARAAEVLSNALEDSGLEGGDVDALRSALAALDGTPEGSAKEDGR